MPAKFLLLKDGTTTGESVVVGEYTWAIVVMKKAYADNLANCAASNY